MRTDGSSWTTLTLEFEDYREYLIWWLLPLLRF